MREQAKIIDEDTVNMIEMTVSEDKRRSRKQKLNRGEIGWLPWWMVSCAKVAGWGHWSGVIRKRWFEIKE